MSSFLSQSEHETRDFGLQFSQNLVAGDIIALYGDLGTGKTRFVQGICNGLGVREQHVSSPTFTLINEYNSPRGKIYHFDCYRLNSLHELYQLGFGEYVSGNGICIIEWAERAGMLLPEARYDVHFSLGQSENQRYITIEKKQETL